MTGGRSIPKPEKRHSGGISTRANGKPSLIPSMAAAAKPTGKDDAVNGKSDFQKIMSRLDSIEVSIESKLDDAIKGQEIASAKLDERVKKTEDENLVLGERVSALNRDSDGTKVQLKVHGMRLAELEDKIERIERDKRRTTLVIDGIPEKEGEVVSAIIDRIFVDHTVGFKSGACAAIYRRGKPHTGDNRGNRTERDDRARPRPIVIVFHTHSDKATVFKNLKNLKEKDEWNKVYFNDDLTEQQANEQRDLRALTAFAKSKGFNSNVKAG